MRSRCSVLHLPRRWQHHLTGVHLNYDGWTINARLRHIIRLKLLIILQRCLPCIPSLSHLQAHQQHRRRSTARRLHHNSRQSTNLRPERWMSTRTTMTAATTSQRRSRRVSGIVHARQMVARRRYLRDLSSSRRRDAMCYEVSMKARRFTFCLVRGVAS